MLPTRIWAPIRILAGLGLLLTSAPAAAAEVALGLFAAPHVFAASNELGKPDAWSGDISRTIQAGLRLDVRPWPWLGGELELTGAQTTLQSWRDGAQPIGLFTARAHATLWIPVASGRLLALAGGGAMASRGADSAKYINDIDAFADAGLGIQWPLFAGIALRADARALITGSSVRSTQFSVEGEATLGFTYHFGTAAPDRTGQDSDGDGLADDHDECPQDAETANGVRDEDGCPELPRLALQHYHPVPARRPADPQTLGAPALPLAVAAQPLAAETTAAALAPDALPPLVRAGDDDLDGLARADDVCPDLAEDADGFEDGDGCPDPDNDGDGVLDEVDMCPLEPENHNGVRDDDGCPEDAATVLSSTRKQPDSASDAGLPGAATEVSSNGLPPLVSGGDEDGDGLLRADDVCPDVAEDKDGFEDDDGCPDPDDDRDGVADTADKCRREGETQNGYDDDDGCPDGVPAPLAEFVGVLQGLVFEKNSAKLLPASEPSLTRVAQVLTEFRLAQVEIAGHTDNSGKRDRNVALSLQRAQAVRAWLVAHGADGARIAAAGYGPDRPKASNKNAKGKAINRRVEFNLVARKPGGLTK